VNTHSVRQWDLIADGDPNGPGPARRLFRFRDQKCSDFVIANTLLFSRAEARLGKSWA
jgi:hypothetical protein